MIACGKLWRSASSYDCRTTSYGTYVVKLLLSSGKRVIIEKVVAKKLQTTETTYNFETAGFHNLDVGWKIGIGLALFALACIITALLAYYAGPHTAAAVWKALSAVFMEFAIGVVSAFAFTAISMAITGDFSLETLGGAVADAIFWGGVFAFVSASVNAVKAAFRSYRAYQERLVKEYIRKHAYDEEDFANIINSFEGKIKLKTSNGIKAHRYYDDEGAKALGRYLTNKPTSNPIRDLVLYNNQATKHTVFKIAKGQKYLVGKIAGSPVHAVQYFVGNTAWLL